MKKRFLSVLTAALMLLLLSTVSYPASRVLADSVWEIQEQDDGGVWITGYARLLRIV